MAQYHLARDGQQLGVFSEAEVEAGLASGRFTPSDLHWTEGMGDWQTVSTRFQTQATYAPTVQAPNSGGFNPYAAPMANVVVPGHGMTLASLGQRLGAALLDGLVGGVVVGIPYVVLIMQMQPKPGQTEPNFSPTAMIALLVMIVAGIALLVVNCMLLAKRGQTLGKKWMGIRIVTFPDGQNPGFSKAVLLRAFVNWLITCVPCLGGIYSLVDICFIFREDRRCIHDLIGGTQVVNGHPPGV